MGKPTISEVAQAANVSKATISRYLNHHYGNMSEATRQRIAKVIAEMGYRPNRQAQSLKSKRSYLIGVVIADISNMYSSLLLKGISSVLQTERYQIMIMNSANSLELEHQYLQRLLDQGVEGIILQAISPNIADYQFLQPYDVKVTLVDRPIKGSDWPLVTSNNYTSTKQLARLVYETGYDQLTVISEAINRTITRQVRFQAIADTGKALHKRAQLKEVADQDSFGLEQIISDLVEEPQKNAIFASNGRMLMLTLKAIFNLGLRIPEDIGVTGYDDWSWTELVGPGITSIEQRPDMIGQKCAEVILAQIAGENRMGLTYELPAELKRRYSL
ncbi:LacI family DNA-binding transcriptional regulator [Agrilactobacillus fermenti]|uniref:LacI family DNA-binding transcriptional regulator n=1 Tax=Agrilactobacillus fermenti TaxID=2586909 RepID=UPI001E46640B|nr:LacI family DNA-binding transcriptional regulator [Agrilactobacillus fermenti]MCD2256963.1 LacI family DNA-binding transcriptional regulator [Agrilactobacillus fermenti]